ncbi:MAG: RHS repeat-associated core domain-containing protein, partial [Kiritimatiellae bacterium]|nr:RHS repeat-associated core domain-containing protein [Kiritimatiellia bacterium]
MKFCAAILTVAFLALSAFAGASVGLPSLTRDGWLYFGYCVVLLMCAAGLVFLARVNYATLRRLPLSLLVAFSLLAVCTSLDAEKTNRLAGVFCQLAELYESPRPRDLPEPSNAVTNFTITAYVVTTSNQYFEAAWPEVFIPHGSRIELHEKSPSLTNGWACVRQYVVEPGQTNLCDTIAITNGSPPSAFYRLYVDALAISFPLLPSTVRSSGYCLTVATSADSIPVVVERPERPPEYPAPDPDFAADPFAHVEGLAYDSTNETVAAAGPGSFELATGDELVVLAPSLSFGTPHAYAGDSLCYDAASDAYGVRPSYPLDEPCLWEGWHIGTNSSWGCTCRPEFDFGTDVSAFAEITNTVEVVDGVAVAKVFLGSTLVWSNSCEHARYWPSGGRSDFLSNDGCSSCGSCASGDCDAFDGPSVGSVRFRISLGSPADGLVSGFLWFDRDAPFLPSPSSFALLKRPDAHVSDATANGTRTVVCSDSGGRTLAVSPITGGVRISVTFTATGRNDRSWEITRENGAMRFRKFNARGDLMSDVSYSSAGGTWAVADNVSGREDVTVSTGNALADANGYSRTVETVSVCGSVTGSHVRVVSSVIGSGADAVLRETERSEKCAGGTWKTSYACYWDESGTRRNGQVRMVWGDDRAWCWTDYDELGREVFRLDQRDGSAAPEDLQYSMCELPGCDAFATVTDYTPHAGDSCHADDWDKPRTVLRYVIHNGASNLVARTWTRYVRGVAANGWPTIAETTIRACSQTACINDPGNAVSTVVRYDDESSLVPYLLRGETVSETDEDGVTETHSHTILSNSVVRTVVSRAKGAHEAKTRAVTERDLAYGLTLYEATQLTADPGVEFGWRRHTYDSRHRLRFTQYDDGSSETNAYDCCRLLFRIDRNGAKTLYCSTPETEKLYHAEEEVSMAALPPGADFTMPGLGYEGMSGRSAFRVTQHFADAFGRETNTVSFASTSQKASVDPSFGGLQSRYRAIAATHYPLGLSDVSAMADARGAVTRIENRSCQSHDETVSALFAAEAPDVAVSVTTNRSFRGGGSLAVRAADGKCVAERHVASYAADGTRIECSTTDSSDCGVVTNRVSECDFLGRVVRVKSPTSDVVRFYDGASPRELSSHDLVSGVVATNVYDDVGDLAGVDSCGVSSRSVVSYECVSGGWWRVEAEIAFAGGATNRNEALRTRLTGLSDEVRSETERTDWGERISRTTSSFDRSTSDLVECEESLADGVRESTRRFGYLWRTSGPDGTWLQYLDYFGWVYYVKWVSPNGGAPQRRMWYERNSLGDIVEEDTFWANTTGSVRTRTFSYDSLGNRVSEENEVGDVVMRGFDSAGRVVSEDGDAYPLRVGYDSAGRRTSLRTTRDAENWDETGWAFDAPTGLCTSKTFADGSAVTNTWTADGLPLRRIAPDGSWTENVYDSSRRKVGQMSGDPSCVFALLLDSFGRTVAASNAVASYTYSLANQGVATNETATVVNLSLDISRAVDSCGRVVSIACGGVRDEIAYCPSNGVMAVISNDEVSVAYSYSDDLLDTGYAISVAGGETFCRAVSRHGHVRDMVLSVTNSTPVATNGWHYYHDNCRRPVSRNADAFAYNSRGEVTNAVVAGVAEAHAYDAAGNPVSATRGVQSHSYGANELNQMTSFGFAGVGTSMHTFDANGSLVHSAPYYPEEPIDTWSYTYDAKSRLTSASRRAYGATDFELVVSNRYDHLDRRVQKITPEATHTYFYDGWMLIKEVVANTNGTTDVIEYHWGKDLSGTIGGAGGVGGLLYLSISNSSTPNSSTHQLYVPFCDAYGNVMGYWDAQGNVVAEYTYDAFGKLISSSGPMADVFAIRYSTKYFDSETGLYYYGYRFYSPDLMRWITRDPIGEEGGENLYAFCGNFPLGEIDP